MPPEIDFHRRSEMNFRIAKNESFISQVIDLIRISDYKPHDICIVSNDARVVSLDCVVMTRSLERKGKQCH